MSLFKRVLSQLKGNQQKRKEGKQTCIPWVDMPKLSTIIPGIEKEKYIVITASPKV